MNEVATKPAAPPPVDVLEQVIISGDLSRLTPAERIVYYRRVCESIGVNPLTKPFEYLMLSKGLVLYATKSCTDQLRAIHGVSIEELTESERGGVFIVTAKARNAAGRTDMAKGSVTIARLQGDALANALMKAETKAKRRVTLSLCGLGMLDETEVESIPPENMAPARAPAPEQVNYNSAPAPSIAESLPPHDPETGEVREMVPRQEPRDILVDNDEDGLPDWVGWGRQYIAAIDGCATLEEANQWYDHNAIRIAEMKEQNAKAYKIVAGAVNAARRQLEAAETVNEMRQGK